MAGIPDAGNCLQQAQGRLRCRDPHLWCPGDSTEGRAGLCWLPEGTRMSKQGLKLPHASWICAGSTEKGEGLRGRAGGTKQAGGEMAEFSPACC